MRIAKRVQRNAYLISRSAGDVAAAQRSPQAYVRRRARRAVTRSVFRMFR